MKFYVLNKRASPSESPACMDFLPVDPVNIGPDAPKCSTCGRFIGLLPWLPPYRVELETYGKLFADLASGPSSDVLISEKFRQLVEEHEVTGFEGFDPVEVVRVKKHRRFSGEPPPYYRVSVVRSQAAIDQVASGFDGYEGPVFRICPVCRSGAAVYPKRWQRIILEPGTWSGEDIFVARGLAGTYLVSERFKVLCEENGITNVVLIPAEEYAHDFYPWEKRKTT